MTATFPIRATGAVYLSTQKTISQSSKTVV